MGGRRSVGAGVEEGEIHIAERRAPTFHHNPAPPGTAGGSPAL